MKARMKMTIVGIILVVLGCLLFVGCSAANGFDWSRLSTQKYEQKTTTTEEAFQSISITDIFANINFLPAADGVCKIEYEESKNITYDITVSADTLIIKQIDNRKWYHHIGFNFYCPTLTVYLPQSAYNTLTVQSKTSDINVPTDFSFENLKIHVSTGDVSTSADVSGDLNVRTSTGHITVSKASPASVTLSASTGRIEASNLNVSGSFTATSSTGNQKFHNITCSTATMTSSTGDKEISSLTASENLTVTSDTGDSTFRDITCGAASVTTSTGDQNYTNFTCTSANLLADTGDVRMANLIASGHLQIQTDTGDISFDRCDAATMNINADTGDVTGTFRTPKIIYATSDTGKIHVPRSTEGGICEITTVTGNINISIAE